MSTAMDMFSLSDTYLLKGATLGDVQKVQGICEVVEFESGRPIIGEGDKNQDIMIVLKGRARVETREGDKIDELRAGAVLGEISFLDGKGRTANVFALGEVKVMVVPADKMRSLMRENPALEALILRNAALALCQRLREANAQIESLLVPR